MIVLRSEEEFAGSASVAALGMFDGVHIGHQKLIRTAVKLAGELGASCVVCTFDRHPLSVLCPERAPQPLLSLAENLEKFRRLGADAALVKPFTRAFADTPPEDYLRHLVAALRVRAIVVGENHTFGAGGQGDAAMIRRLAPALGYRAVVVPPVMDGETVASSTYVRSLLRDGDAAHAARLLRIADEVETQI